MTTRWGTPGHYGRRFVTHACLCATTCHSYTPTHRHNQKRTHTKTHTHTHKYEKLSVDKGRAYILRSSFGRNIKPPNVVMRCEINNCYRFGIQKILASDPSRYQVQIIYCSLEWGMSVLWVLAPIDWLESWLLPVQCCSRLWLVYLWRSNCDHMECSVTLGTVLMINHDRCLNSILNSLFHVKCHHIPSSTYILYNTIDCKLSVVLSHVYWCPCRERQRARRRCCTKSVRRGWRYVSCLCTACHVIWEYFLLVCGR